MREKGRTNPRETERESLFLLSRGKIGGTFCVIRGGGWKCRDGRPFPLQASLRFFQREKKCVVVEASGVRGVCVAGEWGGPREGRRELQSSASSGRVTVVSRLWSSWLGLPVEECRS